MKEDRPVLIAAGGTGGHLFPAEALSVALSRRGIAVELATDARALQYGGAFPARAVHRIAAATPTGGSLAVQGAGGFGAGARHFGGARPARRLRPLCVVGFGGYPTVPPVLAATLLGVPTILHEQNAVMGRANRFLARRVDAIATRLSDARRHRRKTARQSRPHRQSGAADRARGGAHALSRLLPTAGSACS